MIRTLLIVLAVLAAAVLIIALRGEPGSAELTWFHWNVRTTAAAAAILTIFFTLGASLEPGEYAMAEIVQGGATSLYFWDFGVDGNSTPAASTSSSKPK